MKHHPQWGVEILRDTDELTATSFYPVLEHHERGDGGGYPNNLVMGEIHDTSRIVAIADSFDAMTTNRVYQKAMDTFRCPSLLRLAPAPDQQTGIGNDSHGSTMLPGHIRGRLFVKLG